MIMLDATKSVTQREKLESELEAVGIRLNTQRPNVYFKVRLIMELSMDCHHTSRSDSLLTNQERPYLNRLKLEAASVSTPPAS